MIVLVLAFGIAAVQGLVALVVAVILAIGVVLATGRARQVVARLRAPTALALAILLALALSAGDTTLAQIGPLRLRQEGGAAGVLIAGRLLSILAITLALLAPLSPFRLVAGLRGLGLPLVMADLALLTLRYLDESAAELRRARLARALRGGTSGWRALPDHAMLLVTGLIRAQSRADRVYAAMRLRGHGAGVGPPSPGLRAADLAAIGAAIGAGLMLVMLDRAL